MSPSLPVRALAACVEYEQCAAKIAELTEAIGAEECPYAANPEEQAHFGGFPSCFSEAAEEEIDRPSNPADPFAEPLRRRTLDEIEEVVADCESCSRLCRLIRERKEWRQAFGVAKRRVRQIGKAETSTPADEVERAWFCWIPSLGMDPEIESGGLMRAATRGKARYAYAKRAREHDFDVGLVDVRIRRAPEFDDIDFPDGIMPAGARGLEAAA